jgi:hypothetical protein
LGISGIDDMIFRYDLSVLFFVDEFCHNPIFYHFYFNYYYYLLKNDNKKIKMMMKKQIKNEIKNEFGLRAT